MVEKILKLFARFEGGVADEGMLPIYEAATAIHGLARTVNVVNHALANDGEVRDRANTAKGSKSYIHASTKGCFEEQVEIHFSKKVIEQIGASQLTDFFWDFTTFAWSSAVGEVYEAKTKKLSKLLEGHEGYSEEIAFALETPMQELLKPMASDNSMTLILCKPRSDVLTLDYAAYEHVTLIETLQEKEYIVGNVTRFNVLSYFGRMYSDEEECVVSFSLAAPNNLRVKNLVLKSMRDYVEGMTGKLSFQVSKIVGARGNVKRYIIHDIAGVEL